ncbi:hypothetical protein GW17_00032493 [Ensete ventricosum]|nr:hypothetical protein GW17_00032493 [Ensete ventricosum]
MSKASWVFANSLEELEREAVDAISHRVPLIPTLPQKDRFFPPPASSSTTGEEMSWDVDGQTWLFPLAFANGGSACDASCKVADLERYDFNP